MKEASVSFEAQQSLVRLLAKLKCIDESLAAIPYRTAEWCPIAFFSQTGSCEEETTCQAVARHLSMEYRELRADELASLSALFHEHPFSSIEAAKWLRLRMIPLARQGDAATIGIVNPLDLDARRVVEFDLGLRCTFVLVPERQVVLVAGKQADPKSELDFREFSNSAADTESTTSFSSGVEFSRQETSAVGTDIDAAPVIKIVNRLFTDAVAEGASDLHLSPEKEGLVVRFRIDGVMQEKVTIPAHLQNAVLSRVKLLAGMDIAERRRPQDGRFRIRTTHGTRDLRISAVPTVYGENIVARLLASDLTRMSFEQLGMDSATLQLMERSLKGSSRVVLVCGPTGSGKTSTLYASLLSIHRGDRRIVTIEDPIEYRLNGIQQIQVQEKTGVTFAAGLRSVLRQDPDVIMIGEIRDGETADIALQSAQTGHLVLSTIHTNHAAGAVNRLRDLGVPGSSIASGLGMIVAQRLVRCLCEQCSAPLPTDAPTALALAQLGIASAGVREPVGCSNCHGTGFHGRVGIFSVIEISDEIRQLIRDGAGEAAIEGAARRSGYRSLSEVGIELLGRGVTSFGELERALGVITPSPVSSETIGKGASSGMTKRRVLLIEDEDDTRNVLGMLFEQEQYQVKMAASAREGLDAVYAEVPDIIILDHMMPKTSGAELLARLRAEAATRHVPVLMLTAADSEENELRLLGTGADDFVSKSADPKVLLARMQRLLARV